MKILSLIALVFFFHTTFSQKIIDLKADLLSVEERGITIYKKSNTGKLREFDFELAELYDNEYSVVFYSELVDGEYIITDYTLVDSLPSINQTELKESLIEKSFYSKERGYLFRFDYFNSVFFTLRMYEFSEEVNNKTNEFEKKWRLIDTMFYNYFLLRLNQEKLVVVLVLLENVSSHNWIDIEGFILPKNDSYTISIPYDFFDDSNGEKKELSYKDDFDYHFQNIELYRVEDGNKVKDLVFNLSVIEDKFDTVFISNNFIVGTYQNKLSLYNLKLDNITPSNTRAYQIGSDDSYCQILVKNKIYWLNESGTRTIKKGEVNYFVCGTTPSASLKLLSDMKKYKIEKIVEDFSNEQQPETNIYELFNKGNYDNVLFLNSTDSLYYDYDTGSSPRIKFPGNPYNYLIVEKDKKYGIIEISFESDTISNKVILPLEFDNIKAINYYSPILFMKRGRYGYFPLQKNPKYKELGTFEGSFARFTLPNNKKGWLSLDGKEYLDE